MAKTTPYYKILDEQFYKSLIAQVGVERLVCHHPKCNEPLKIGQRIYRKFKGHNRLAVYYHAVCWDGLSL